MSNVDITGGTVGGADVAAIGATTNASPLLGSPATGATSVLVFDGDSITASFGLLSYITTTETFAMHNTAVNGRQIPQMQAAAFSSVDTLWSSVAQRNILVFLGGCNDLYWGATVAQTYNNLIAYCRSRKRAGWIVIVCTLISHTGAGFDGWVCQLNQMIRNTWQSFADGLSDLAANPLVGQPGAYSNGTYFLPDGVHPQPAGMALLGATDSAVINSYCLKTRTVSPPDNAGGNDLALYCSYTLTPAPDASLPDAGGVLTDGLIRRRLQSGIEADVGWNAVSPTIVIDLGASQWWNEVDVYVGGGGATIHAPLSATVSASPDNVAWTVVGTYSGGNTDAEQWLGIKCKSLVQARYVKVVLAQAGWITAGEVKVLGSPTTSSPLGIDSASVGAPLTGAATQVVNPAQDGSSLYIQPANSLLVPTTVLLGSVGGPSAKDLAYVTCWDVSANSWSIGDATAGVLATFATHNVPFTAAMQYNGATWRYLGRIYVSSGVLLPVGVTRYALVVNWGSGNVTPVDMSSPLAPVAHTPVGVGTHPYGMAIAPNGKFAIVPCYGSVTMYGLDLTIPLAPVAGTPQPLTTAFSIAISSNNAFALATHFANPGHVVPIDLTNPLVPVAQAGVVVGQNPTGVHISYDRTIALVANNGSNTVSVVGLASPLAPTILCTVSVGTGPTGIAISPNGTYGLVACAGTNNVLVLNLSNPNSVTVMATVAVGTSPAGLCIAPDGRSALVANNTANTVTPLDMSTPSSPVTHTAVPVGAGPYGVAISPDGSYGFTSNSGGNSITPLDLSSPLAPVAHPSVAVGTTPYSLGIPLIYSP